MSTAEIEAREILEEIYIKGKSPAAVLINFINGKNKEIAEYKDKYNKLNCNYKRDIDYRKAVEKAEIKKARIEARKEVFEKLISMCDAPHWCVWLSEITDLAERMEAENNNAES